MGEEELDDGEPGPSTRLAGFDEDVQNLISSEEDVGEEEDIFNYEEQQALWRIAMDR